MNNKELRAKFEEWALAHYVKPNLSVVSGEYKADYIAESFNGFEAGYQQAAEDMQSRIDELEAVLRLVKRIAEHPPEDRAILKVVKGVRL